ncbi:MAG: general secretion pathway protein GspK [Akkermansiaceae bacterium]|nr:general secretion pathway protein GspK [Verrucomicrobiales bacterium]
MTLPNIGLQSRTDVTPVSHASILVGLLWCLALLSLVVIGVLHTARMDLHVGKNYGDRIQAHYLALAGIEKAKALVYQDAKERSRSRQNHGTGLYNAPEEFRNIALGRGEFQVFRRGRDDEGGGVFYGVSDEDSRLNINAASTDALGKLNGMTPELVAAIADWRDADNGAMPGGAESEYYLSMQPPYQTRNGPFQTIRELLMVRGMSVPLLFGNDSSHNSLLDAEDEEGKDVFVNEHATDADLGWARWLTVNSRVSNVNAAGEDRVNVQSADEAALTKVPGITQDIARAIVSYRGQNQFQSIADLLDVTSGGATNRGGSGASRNQNQSSGSGASGRKVISEELLMDIGDDVTVLDSSDAQQGWININTAGLDVLATLPGVDRQMAQAIISHRQSSGFFPNVAGLLKVPGISANNLKQLAPLITVRSETFRIFSEGKVKSSGVRQRIETVVHLSLTGVKTLSYREDDL